MNTTNVNPIPQTNVDTSTSQVYYNSMITYEIESRLPGEDSWHTVWITPAERASMQELIMTLGRYRTNHPDCSYRLVKHEVIG